MISSQAPISFDWDGTLQTSTKGEAKNFLSTRIIPNSYMSQLKAAVGGGLTVHGAPPGMDARLSNVRAGGESHYYMFVKSSDFRLEVNFLKNEMGLVFDDSGYLAY